MTDPSSLEQLTVRRDDDPKYNGENMTNEFPEELFTTFDYCSITICGPVVKEIAGVRTNTGSCASYSWTSWGSWSQCDLSCSRQGVRKRSRSCRNVCHGEKEADDLCPGFLNSFYNRTVMGSDWTRCSPCPAELLPSWSEWGDWRIAASYHQYCGPGPVTLQRERACVRGKESKASCLGEETEYKTVPRPGCQGEHTADYFQHDTEVRQSVLLYIYYDQYSDGDGDRLQVEIVIGEV